MSIEYCFRYPDSDEDTDLRVGATTEFGHGLIEDEGIFFADYTDAGKEIIAVERVIDELECGEWVEKARVRTFPAVGVFEEDMSGETVDEQDLPQPEDEFEIDEDEFLELDVRNSKGEEVILIIRQTDSDQITQSGLIPEGLRYPN